MASPALESMCCLFNNTEDHPGHHHLSGISMRIYNCLCILSASISICGACYQLLPRKPALTPRTTRELESWIRQTSIICWLAFADLLASLGVLIRSAAWLSGFTPWQGNVDTQDTTNWFCAISTGWIQYFYICTYLWTLCYAIDIFRLVHDIQLRMRLYHFAGWIISLALCLTGLLSTYLPSIDNCRYTIERWLPQFLTTYVPILAVMAMNPVLYYKASNKVESTIRSRGLYTDTERSVVRNLKKKFLLFIVVFYICWFPNIVNGVLLLTRNITTTSRPVFLLLWNFMALVNPMQAFLNSLVYRGHGGCQLCMKSFDDDDLIPRNRRHRRLRNQDSQGEKDRSDIQNCVSTDFEHSSETSPLLSFRL